MRQTTLKYYAVSIAFFCSLNLIAQVDVSETDSLPKVFKIGEYEEQYGSLYEEYHDILLSVCNEDMSVAFDRWMHMLMEMEEYSKAIEFDLNGVKVWLKLFWNSNGSVDHISYYLKPDSRNIDVDELAAFFSSFMNHYQMPIDTKVKFTHNGSAQFPTSIPRPVSKK